MQRAHGGKQGDKGLRHFSMKVCEKVEQKGRTTYNEVADELVNEFAVAATEMVSQQDAAYDEKNIRRYRLEASRMACFLPLGCMRAARTACILLLFPDTMLHNIPPAQTCLRCVERSHGYGDHNKREEIHSVEGVAD